MAHGKKGSSREAEALEQANGVKAIVCWKELEEEGLEYTIRDELLSRVRQMG